MKNNYKNEGGEETMTEERNYTPFDGKQNDWIFFAKQQAEFYKNAEQYITNIQLDIDESMPRSKRLWKCSPQIITQTFLSWKMSRKKYML